MIRLLAFLLLGFQTNLATDDVGVFAKALWFMQAFGEADCATPSSDRRLKSALALALAKDRTLTIDELNGLIRPEAFEKFAGSDRSLTEAELVNALEQTAPKSRRQLLPELRRHAELLTTTYDMIPTDHLDPIDKLADWIAKNWKSDGELHILSTCTGNSRRSILGATMGNLAASYYGFENVHFHSGGTLPSAFNKRTIATLKEIGFQVEPTGEEGERCDPKTPNPLYRITWGKGLEAVEFSKSYKDKSNPQTGFAAVLVCSEADAECPTVPGAALRLSMIFIDPKLYDDGAFETKKYAERRDDIGRTFLAVMANARRRLQEQL